jgi:hypothetical protein
MHRHALELKVQQIEMNSIMDNNKLTPYKKYWRAIKQ